MMTSSVDPVRETAVRLLTEVEGGARLDSLLEGVSITDGRDRRFLHQLTAGAIKWRDRLDWILNSFSKRPVESLSPAIRQVLRLGAYQLLWLDRVPERAAVHSAVELAKRFEHTGTGGFVNAVLRRVIAEARQVAYPDRTADPEAYFSVFYSHPRWLVSRWLKSWGPEQTEALLGANNEAAPLFIRAAGAAGNPSPPPSSFGPEAVDDHPGVYRLSRPEGVFEDPTFIAGWFAQDISAGLAARLLGPEPGDRILDVCAAPGGKSAQLAAAVGDGMVIATDLSPPRLRRLRGNMRRLHQQGVRLVAEDGQNPSALGPFDRVLVDVPCSGTGVLGRHPEARWRKAAADLPRHAVRQLGILEAAYQRLRAGGVLVYSTCSLEQEENDAVVDHFLSRNQNARLEVASRQFPQRPWAARTIQTLPGRDVGDGAYAARIRRLSGSMT
jgi:16S rRNA (cytosine967-C5)-methyltransferase